MISKTVFVDKKIQKNLKIICVKKKKFLTYETSKAYLTIPVNILIEKKDDALILYSTKKNTDILLKKFADSLLKFLINANKIYKKIIRLKGLGFKTLLFKNRTRLRLKLGFSHFIKIFIPKSIQLFRNKKKTAISAISKDSVLLGNFCKIIKSLKMPNSYTGNGFSYNKEKFILKSFKKK